MDHFELVSQYAPTGDQPRAIEELVKGFKEGNQFQTLLGVTGSGKTFTMANVIQQINKPTLVIAHNKTLAAQLYGEFKEFFPNNAVEYFVSYYDYYQPEAYVPSTDTYIAKDSSVNEEIDKLRLSATAALIERKDVIIISSVSLSLIHISAILAKCGIKKTDSNVATAIRTVVVLLFSWLMVLITGTGREIRQIDGRTFLFLVLSGLATGASWLCYFRALQKGDINKVVPIDKSSTVLTIWLALIFLQEGISGVKILSLLLIGGGTLLMIDKKDTKVDREKESGGWLIYAVLSAVFASLTAILGKIGIAGIDSNLGTAIRTTVVLVMAWMMVFLTGKQKEIRKTEKKELVFICLSGLATGASWLCYYRALKDGLASVVVPIDKLSMLVTIAFSWFVFHEKLTKKAAVGVIFITAGTVLLAVI